MYIVLDGLIMFSFIVFVWFVVIKINKLEKAIEHEKKLSAERDEWCTEHILLAFNILDENLLSTNPLKPLKTRVEDLEKEIIILEQKHENN